MSTTINCSRIALSLFVPCYNEAQNVALFIERLAELAPTVSYPFEVIFADGGSDDGTPDVIRVQATARGLGFISVEEMPPRGGYGRDIMAGLAVAQADVLAWTHADMQTDPKDVLDAYSLYQSQIADYPRLLIKGKRKNRPFFDVLFTLGMQVFTLATVKMNISDINAQPKMFSREFYSEHMLQGAPDDFSLDLFTLIQARRHNFIVQTLPVVFADRAHGEAKGGGGGLPIKIKLARRTIKYIIETRRRVG